MGRVECSDPLKRHKKKYIKSESASDVRKISFRLLQKLKDNGKFLKPETLLCTRCRKIIDNDPQIIPEHEVPYQSEESSNSSHPPSEISMNPDETGKSLSDDCSPVKAHSLASALKNLDVTPVKKSGMTSQRKRTEVIKTYVKAKRSLKRKLEESIEVQMPSPKKFETDTELKKLEDTLLPQLIQEFQSTKSYARKLKILTLSPFTIKKTCEIFSATQYLVKKSREIVKNIGIIPEELPKFSKGKVVSSDTKNYVKYFYESEEISRICPGKSDYLSVKNIMGEKVHEQKRLILLNLKEAFEVFKTSCPEKHKIGFSTFANLRPKYCVLAGGSGTHSVCVCIYHQNPKLQISALFSKDIDYKLLMQKAVCNVQNRDCMMQLCKLCPKEKGIKALLQNFDHIESLTYKQWITTDRCTLTEITESFDQYTNSLSNKIIKLTRHHFVAKSQGEFFKELKNNLKNNEAVILGDFSENYSFVVQDEAQGFHWENSQATVHPFVVYFKENGELSHKSFCFLSPVLKHNTIMVYTFQKILVPEVKNLCHNLDKIHYFTDGCAGQYKNKYNFMNITYHFKDFGITCEWHFHATSHGKGSCDGIGAIVKRCVAKASLQRAYHNQILNTEEMFNFCKENLGNRIQFFYIDQKEIEITENFLKNRYTNVSTLVGTQKFHRFVPLEIGKVMVYETSSEEIGIEKYLDGPQATPNMKSISPEIGQYILCHYNSVKWVGLVLSKNEEFQDYEIDFLHPSGINPFYFFPQIKDKCNLPPECIIKILKQPNLKAGTSRIQYSFNIKEIQ